MRRGLALAAVSCKISQLICWLKLRHSDTALARAKAISSSGSVIVMFLIGKMLAVDVYYTCVHVSKIICKYLFWVHSGCI